MELARTITILSFSFGYTDEMLSAPIARDWHTWNAVDNRGEVDALDMLGKSRS